LAAVKPEEGRIVRFADLLVVLDASDWVDRLRLPASSARECAGEMPGGVALYHTGGSRYWNVNAEHRGPDVLILTIGWRHFVIENALLRGTRLRLRYRGNGNFWVSVWDLDGFRVTTAPRLLTR
jgi:hypothetical protein